MGFSYMRDDYRKLLDKAALTVNSIGEFSAIQIYNRLRSRCKARGYSVDLIANIIAEQHAVPNGKSIPLSPELQHKLNKLSKALTPKSRLEGERKWQEVN